MKHFFLILVLIWAAIISQIDGAASGGGNQNPYKVLGVSKDATQEEITKKYRRMCLKYHPDKNVDKSLSERNKCEDEFKNIQRAHSLVGDEDARRKYDSPAFGNGGQSGNQFGSSAADDLFRSFYDGAGSSRRTSFGSAPHPFFQRQTRTPFYFNGVDISGIFDRGTFGSPLQTGKAKAVYVQYVKIPLQDLYSGKSHEEFELNDSIWQRYKAAFQGGSIGQIVFQGFIACVTLSLRLSLPALGLVFLMFIHCNLPRPSKLFYDVEIKRGWKGGTRLKFEQVDPGFEVIFVIQEGKHDRFERDGNNLQTTISITKSKARKGCSLFIDPLSDVELPVIVKLKPGEVSHDGQVVTVKGRGWPRRKNGDKGDLLVKVNLVPDSKYGRGGRINGLFKRKIVNKKPRKRWRS